MYTESYRAHRCLVTACLFSLLILGAVGSLSAQERPGPAMSPQDRPITSLRDLNTAFVDIVADVKPAVVTVSTERTVSVRQFNPFGTPFSGDFFDFFFGPGGHPNQRGRQPEKEYRQRGLGSGVIVSDDGYVLTNNHVVEDADTIFVRTYDGNRYTATVVGTDPHTDIAVLRIDADGLDYVPIGNSDELKVGEIVLAVGSPMSENLAYTVTQGIVSATGRSNVGLADYEDFVQTDAAINPGNSGGPLINLDGQLVGINTAIASRSGGFQGIGFAVPSNMAVRIMNSLITEGRVVRGWLGVYIQDVNQEIADAMGLEQSSGALVGDVVENSPAAGGGLKPGDLITAVDGRAVRSAAALRSQIASSPPEAQVDLTVMRDDRSLHIPIRLGELPEEVAAAGQGSDFEELLGFTAVTADDAAAERYDFDSRLGGVVVTSINQASAAYRAGIREGDLIRAANRRRVRTVDEFREILQGAKRGDSVLLRIHRDGNSFFVAFTL